MAEQVAADVGFDADAEGVPPVADDIIQEAAQRVGRGHDAHDREEQPERTRREHAVDRIARQEREGQIDERGDRGAGDVQRKQPEMRPEIGQEDAQQTVLAIILRVFHCSSSLCTMF